ncbi:MAG: NADH-quinone oxidoreductase subunit C [Limisphaerales bacterium]
MSYPPIIETIALAELLERVRARRAAGARLVQVSVTALPEHFELTYSFDRDGILSSLRLLIPASDPRVPSISGIYACAFLYENEMHDLFNLRVEGMNVDFHGTLYNTTVKYAFSAAKPPLAKKAPASAPAGV